MKNTHFISKINTGGGHEVDYYLYKKNDNIWKAAIVNEEGASLYTIRVDDYKKQIEEEQEFLKRYYDEKEIKYDDVEWLFWITIERFDFTENSIVYHYCMDHEGYNYFDYNSKKREEICKEIMEIYIHQ